MAALRAWREQRAWARRDPATLTIASVAPVGPTQLVLTSRYEARGVRYALRAAPSRPVHNEPGPDPWSVRLVHPPGAAVGHELESAISGATVHMDCGLCSGNGDMACPECGGSGRIQAGRHSHTCGRCGGRGEVVCGQCGGTGGLLGEPRVWSRIAEVERIQVHEPESLPLDVFLALSEHKQEGELVHRQEAERIVDLTREGGYRDAASTDDPVRLLARRLAEAPGVPEGGRVIAQRLEVRRVPAWEVTLDAGPRVWVYGTPPAVSPANALRSVGYRAATIGPFAAGALGAVAWALYRFLA